MPRLKLSAATLKALRPPPKPQQVDYFDVLFPALSVRVSYAGRKTFVLHRRVGIGNAAKVRRFTLGHYPALSLADAREKARTWKEDARGGLDPITEDVRREAAAQTKTFAATVTNYLDSQTRLRPTTLREYRRFLTGPDVAAWSRRHVDTITRADVSAVLDRIDGRGKDAASNHALSYLRRFFNWCADRNLVEHPPTDRIRARHPHSKRDRALSTSELAAVLEALDDDATLVVIHGATDLPPMTDIFRDYFRLMILTGQRRAEVAGMQWAEVRDLDGKHPQWELPGARTKNGRDHIVPLAPAAVAILKRRHAHRGKSDYVFSGTGETPLSGIGKAHLALSARLGIIAKATGALDAARSASDDGDANERIGRRSAHR